jgi:hypothetical protein
VKSFFLGKQKVVLFPKYRENGWETAASALKRNCYPPFLLPHIFSAKRSVTIHPTLQPGLWQEICHDPRGGDP